MTKEEFYGMDVVAANAIKGLMALSGRMKGLGVRQDDYDIPTDAARDIAVMLDSLRADVFPD